MKQSLLILPFQNLSFSVEDEYLSDGITEELILALSQLDHLEVASRTSSFYFKGKHFSLEELEQKLRVTHVLEGSIRKQEQRIRLIVHLTEISSGFTRWSATFDKTYNDLIALQNEIAREIVSKFNQTISADQLKSSTLRLVPDNDPIAYDWYLKGMFYYNQYTMENISKGVDCFLKAVQRQSDFGLAHAYLAQCYMALGGYIHPSRYALAKQSAIKAIALDENLQQAQLSLAMVQLFYDWDWKAAKASIQKALDLDIRSADAHRMLAIYSFVIGQAEEAVYAHELATKYDPLNVIYLKGLGWSLTNVGRYEEAFEEYERCLEIDPSFYPALEGMGWVRVYQKRWEEAIYYFKQYQQIVGHPLKGWFGLGYAFAKTGETEAAYEIIQRLDKRRAGDSPEVLDLDYALIYLGLGNLDKTFDFLNNAVDNHHIITIGSLALDPVFEEIRGHERFQQILERIGLRPFLASKKDQKTNEVLVVQSETKERIELIVNQLLYIEADGNYSRFFWKDGKKKKERFLRIGISGIIEQISKNSVTQVHRSFIANLRNFDKLKRQGRQYFLENNQLNIRIPISRQKATEIKRLYEEMNSL